MEEPTDTPIKDILSVASVKIFQSDNILHFIIKFLKIKLACKKITTFPVAHNNVMLRLVDNIIAECNGEMYAIQNCSTTPGVTFCRLSAKTTCARELHAGGVAHCETQPSDLHPITYVDEGIMIINDQSAQVRVDNGTSVWIHGTHLVTFSERVTVNETLVLNQNSAQKRTPGVASSPSLNITISQNTLSLPYLHRLSERNLEYIQKFGNKINTNQTHMVALITGVICCALICVGLTYMRLTGARRSAVKLRRVIAEIGSAEGGLNLEGGVVN